jgi:hypothetical protein
MAEPRIVELPNPLERQLIDRVVTLLATVRDQRKRLGVVMPQMQAQHDAFAQVVDHSLSNPNDPTIINTFVTNAAPAFPPAQNAGFLMVANLFPPMDSFANVPQLGYQIGNLVSAVRTAIQGGVGANNEDLGAQYTNANCQCMAIGPISGMTFAQIQAAAVGGNLNKFSQEIGKGGAARSRLEWRFNDGSMIAIDVPGLGVKELFRVSTLPHAEKRSPNEYEHMTDSGVVVPATSDPAHIQFNWKEYSLKNYLVSQGGQRPDYPGAG